MKLKGSIIQRALGNDPSVAALQALIGTNIYGDEAFHTATRPYVTATITGTTNFTQSKASGNAPQIRDMRVEFQVYTVDGVTCDSILDALEAAFLEPVYFLTLDSPYSHIGLRFIDRHASFDATIPGGGWTGIFELAFKITKN
jgi:hypothetical protein